MSLPEELEQAIQNELRGVSGNKLREAREELSHRYRERLVTLKHAAMTTRDHRLAYITTRMPATYGVVYRVLEEIQRTVPSFSCRSLLDLGAGPGTASWAASTLFPDLETITLVERDSEVISIGKRLAQSSSNKALRSANWISEDLLGAQEFPLHDMVLISYAIGELPKTAMTTLLSASWKSTNSFLCVIEPGTPVGYQHILEVRNFLISSHAHLTAPCPHSLRCPMEGTSSWCHFSQHIERTAQHRRAKEGSLSYEDEKYSYVVGSKRVSMTSPARIVGHPQKRSGHVCLTLCTAQGIENITISRKQGDEYRSAKKAEWGDAWIPKAILTKEGNF